MQPLRVEITPADGENPAYAQIGTLSFPLVTYAVEQGESGPLVSLLVAAEQISVGRSPSSDPAPAPAEKVQLRTWGDPSLSDPRESIPGWRPSVGEQTARNAEASA